MKIKERVTAEITLSHLIRLAHDQGCPMSYQEALAFFNQNGQAFEMWKIMMHAAEDFITNSLLHHGSRSGDLNEIAPVAEVSISHTEQ